MRPWARDTDNPRACRSLSSISRARSGIPLRIIFHRTKTKGPTRRGAGPLVRNPRYFFEDFFLPVFFFVANVLSPPFDSVPSRGRAPFVCSALDPAGHLSFRPRKAL